MASIHRVDEEAEGSSKQYLTDYEVNYHEIKPLPSHGRRSNSCSSSGLSRELFEFNVTSNDNENPKESQPKSSRNLCVSFSSSSEMQVYLSNRIPSSVFRTKSGTQKDWSAASSESLFSIHINNCSYSKEQFLMLYKSGEFTKLDEQIMAQKDVLPSLKELDNMAAMDEDMDKGLGKAEMTVETGEVAEDDSEPNVAQVQAQAQAQAEEFQGSVSNAPMVHDGAVEDDLSMEKKPTAEPEPETEAHNKPIKSLSNLYVERNISISFTFPVLTAADGGTLSSACADQNKGLPTQQQPPQQQPQMEEEEQKENTEEKEAESQDSPQNDSSNGWLSFFPCCRR
ncbi:hypothetical protein V6N13_126590 [Hibiscus sabdariffa]|uniref:Uncharacterized protein n=1 Tax=Hibiscus sabdariffa TaxID=183260 RepID=A0ABR2RFG6_9ROSI